MEGVYDNVTTTTYTVLASDAEGDTLTFTWWTATCGVQSAPVTAYDSVLDIWTSTISWDHAHPPCPVGNHLGEPIQVVISDGSLTTTCTYNLGGETGTGPACSSP
jgi:hypothetical protein